jgi:hypothetical protein
MAIPERKILSPKGRPSRPLREIRAAIRKVAAATAAEKASPDASGRRALKTDH